MQLQYFLSFHFPDRLSYLEWLLIDFTQKWSKVAASHEQLQKSRRNYIETLKQKGMVDTKLKQTHRNNLDSLFK